MTVLVTSPVATVTLASGALTVTHGSAGSVTLSVTPTGGATGTVTLGCSMLPAHLSCTLTPATLTLSGTTTQTSMLTVGTTATSALALPARPGSRGTEMAVYACALLPLFGLGVGRRRRWTPGLSIAVLLLGGATLGLAGCSGSSPATSTTTAPGTYTVLVTATLSGTTTSTSQATLTVVVQ